MSLLSLTRSERLRLQKRLKALFRAYFEANPNCIDDFDELEIDILTQRIINMLKNDKYDFLYYLYEDYDVESLNQKLLVKQKTCAMLLDRIEALKKNPFPKTKNNFLVRGLKTPTSISSVTAPKK